MLIAATASRSVLARQVAFALSNADAARRDPDLVRRALMYAEAIDDADEADALFRFGPKLRDCLDSLGIDVPFLALGRSVASAALARAA